MTYAPTELLTVFLDAGERRKVGRNWQETVLHLFSGQPDGSSPTSRLLFDSTGNLYGTTFFGGSYNDGAAYELSPGNGGWTESVIYSFNEGNLGKGVALPAGYLSID